MRRSSCWRPPRPSPGQEETDSVRNNGQATSLRRKSTSLDDKAHVLCFLITYNHYSIHYYLYLHPLSLTWLEVFSTCIPTDNHGKPTIHLQGVRANLQLERGAGCT